MNETLTFAMICVTSLFVIVDPIGAIPTFLAVTGRNTVEEKVRMSRTAAVSTFIILTVFLFAGNWIFKLLRISLSAFTIAGGVILMIVAIDMLQARQTSVRESHEEKDEAISKEDVAITPLAIPMLAGPGSITTVLLLAQRASDAWHYAVLVGAIFLISMSVYFTLRYAAVKSTHISVIALRILTRLMGLLLAAISVQFILDGVQGATFLW